MFERAGQTIALSVALALCGGLVALGSGALHRSRVTETSGAFPGRGYASFPGDGNRTPAATTSWAHVTRSSPPIVTMDTGKATALIVGISQPRGTRSLPGSVADATNLRDALLAYGFSSSNITMLLDGAATRPAILNALDSLAARTPRSGVAVFAIATHTKRQGGSNSLATAEGRRISARELAGRLRAVRARTWVALPTCYAEGYALPGIVGPRRIATFATTADRPSYQAGEAGSILFIHLVRRAMLEGRAPYSVETAFAFAHREIDGAYPEYLPTMSDGIPGDLVLGRWHGASNGRPVVQASERRPETDDSTQLDPEASRAAGDADPPPQPEGEGHSGFAVCGRVRYNCSS